MLALRVVVALAAVAGAIWYFQRRFAKRQGNRAAKEPITLIGRQGLGAKAQLVVVETSGKRYVLGVTERGVSVVDTLDAEPTPEPEPGEAATDAGAHTGTMTSTARSDRPRKAAPTDGELVRATGGDFERAMVRAAANSKRSPMPLLGGLTLPSDMLGRFTGLGRRSPIS